MRWLDNLLKSKWLDNLRGKRPDSDTDWLGLVLAAMFFVVVILSLLLQTGCALFGSSKSGTTISAPHSTDALYGALHAAEDVLGQKHAGGKIHVRFEEGDTPSSHGWLGKRVDGGVLGGQTTSHGNMLLYLTHGQVHPHNSQHEMAHAILYSRGIEGERHHDIMRAAGFRW